MKREKEKKMPVSTEELLRSKKAEQEPAHG